MKCTILGCGGSLGVPQLLCQCYVCKSKDSRNYRKRASIYIESDTTKILIDASQDFKTQAVLYNINKVDSLLFTHSHSDHISGINDLKPFANQMHNRIDAYLNEPTYNNIRGTYGYLFETDSKIYQPILNPHIIDNYSKFTIGDIEIASFVQNHGEINSLGFRFGKFAYSTDFNALPPESVEALKGVEVWVVGCLRYSWSPSHLSYEKVLDYIDLVKPKRAILTHMAHEIDFEEISNILPASIEPAYDGMVIDMNNL